jgi:hypothetical protein
MCNNYGNYESFYYYRKNQNIYINDKIDFKEKNKYDYIDIIENVDF